MSALSEIRPRPGRVGAILLLALLTASASLADTPKIVSVKKIWDQGRHNAFTDLIRWRGKWYCTFREADGHVGGDGKLRVLESADGDSWKSVGLLAEEGIDLRDPKLSITPDDRLMIVAGGSVYRGTRTLMGRQPRVAFSADGKEWTVPRRVLEEGEWLWRVTWHGGKAYGVSYNAQARKTQAAQDAAKSTQPVPPGPADWKLKLVVSDNGTDYQLVTHLDVPGHPNETTLRFLPGGEMMAMVRREGGSTLGWIGVSKPPYREWKWLETTHRFGGPNFIRLPSGSLWAASRLYPGGPRTVLARLDRDLGYEPVLTLPSGGDTSYAGLAWHEGQLWMSYYSSHEGKSSIYLAKIEVPDDTIDMGKRLEPLVDHHLIDGLAGDARLRLHRPEPGEVVLVADRPWEGNTCAYFTIFQDGDRYRMYYRGWHHDEKTKKAAHREVTCYAESKDGLSWTRPSLGLFEFEGSRDNNIVWDGPGTHNFTPFKDPNPRATPDARYKALARVRGGLQAFKSADGIHWSPMSDGPVITRGAFDSQNLAFWDPLLGKYREYHRDFRGIRDIRTGTSDDFLTWTDPVFLEYPGAPKEHLYTNAILPYERAPHLLVGFPTRYLARSQQVEPVFMSSRDGLRFLRWSEPVIPRTAPKDREGNRSNYMAWGLVQLPGSKGELTVYGTEAYYAGPAGRLRRFTYRLDGFVSAHAATGGELITRLLRSSGSGLVLNYKTGAQGSIRAEVQDAAGQPLPGLSLADCEPLQGDSLEGAVRWKSGASLAAHAGKPLRLRFELKDADLFSLRLR